MRLTSTALATALALFATPALAQFAGTGGGDIQLYADDVVNTGGVTTLRGQVDARQGDVRILADEMLIYSKARTASSGGPSLGANVGDIDRIVATGNFYSVTSEQEVRGDKGVYTADTEQFDVTGNVVLVQDESVVRGNRLIYDLKTERARVLSDCKGRRCGTQRRVAILIKNTGGTNTAPTS